MPEILAGYVAGEPLARPAIYTSCCPTLRNRDGEAVTRLFRDHVDPRFELHLPPDYPEGEQVLRGRKGMNAFASVLRETWSEWRFVPQRFLDAQDRVQVFARLVAVVH